MALDENIGISKIASLGNRVNVDFGNFGVFIV